MRLTILLALLICTFAARANNNVQGKIDPNEVRLTEDKAVIESAANFYGLDGTIKRFPLRRRLSGQRATMKKRKAAKANSCSLS